MAKWSMVIDLDKCVACQGCSIACRFENNTPVVAPDEARLGRAMRWNDVFPMPVNPTEDTGEYPNVKSEYVPRPCMHCENPPCLRVCPTGATYQRDDGLVLIDYDKCIGCRYCMEACPYDARYLDPERGVADKCTFCVHRLDAGQPPACVETCVGGSRHYGDLNDPSSDVAKLLATRDHVVIYEEAGTGPAFYYIP